MGKIIPPLESAVMVCASLSAILNHVLQPNLTFLGRQGVILGLSILHLKKEVIVLVRLPIVVAALLYLALAEFSGSSVSRAPATGAVDSPVRVVTKLNATLVAVSVLTLHEIGSVLRSVFKIETVFSDVVLGWIRHGAGNSRCHCGQDSEDIGDLHDEDGCNGL